MNTTLVGQQALLGTGGIGEVSESDETRLDRTSRSKSFLRATLLIQSSANGSTGKPAPFPR
jgi:hypothetical protein